MDDLSSLDRSSRPEDTRKKQPLGGPLPTFAALRPTPPASGRSSPLPKAPSTSPAKSQAPADDSFSNLVSFASATTQRSLSLQEQQNVLQERKAQQQATKQKQFQSQYSGGDEQFWNNLGSGRSTPAPPATQSYVPSVQVSGFSGGSDQKNRATENLSNRNTGSEDVDDILAAFKADAPVDSSSYFPKPAEGPYVYASNEHRSASSKRRTHDTQLGSASTDSLAFEDDDPFGLARLPQTQQPTPSHSQAQDEEDDVLGLLGKPVSEIVSKITRVETVTSLSPAASRPPATQQEDQAMAELMEMGFPAEKAKEALESTQSGTDVQEAVGWLLNRAHSEARQKSRPRRNSNHGPRQSRDPKIDRKTGSKPDLGHSAESRSGWSDDTRPGSTPHPLAASSEQGEKDPALMATEFGTNLFKTAGTLWKTSTKKVQQAVQDFNSDSDSSQPRWMRESGTPKARQGNPEREGTSTQRSHRGKSVKTASELVTDEAIMLESDRAQPRPRRHPRDQGPSLDSSTDNSRDHSPAASSGLREEHFVPPAFLRPRPPKTQTRPDSKSALSRQSNEDQASQAYISSARRRKPTSTSAVTKSEPDLLDSAAMAAPQVASRPASTQPIERAGQPQRPRPVAARPAAPSRTIPLVSSISLKASHADREAGNVHFKRGDYPAAHHSYTLSLKHLPSEHPFTIILLTNRALTALKIGEPKSAISDTESAIAVIGVSRGEAETIDLNNGESARPMRDYYGKALMRKAEALEQMEKWTEAAAAWKEAVEGGHGGSASIQGRIRCKNAVVPQQPRRPKAVPARNRSVPALVRSAISDLNGTSFDNLPSAEAVQRLRASNAAADKADDEKFALADTVDAKLTAWKSGKADNLRALLGSLDTVLWPGAGWKKVGMAELVLPGKVKVQYMKGIAKVHPDKIPTTATTEQRMIAGAVFSSLNEAWDKFKAENGL